MKKIDLCGNWRMKISRHGVTGTAGKYFFILFPNISYGRTKHHANGIAPHLRQLPDVVLPYAVHILHMPQQRAVQIDLTQRIDSFKAQHDSVVCQHVLGDLHVRLI